MPDSILRKIGLNEFCRRLRSSLEVPDSRYIFFLGAGCSVTSGIPDAGSLVKNEWLPRLHDHRAKGIEYEKWIKTAISHYNPKNPAASYGPVMESLFLFGEEKQQEIERLCENKFPDFGYAILAELITLNNGKFNVVITSNFDDLMADAMYLFTRIKPLVINHDSLAKFIRPTRTRPLIVKLHGDYHLAPLNTEIQTKKLKNEFEKNLSPLLNDRGLIFIGYGGNDIGIKKWLESLPERALPYGVYWISSIEPICELKSWLVSRDAIWVQHFDFNEIMVMFKDIFNISLPEPKKFVESLENKIFETYQRVAKNVLTQTDNTPESIILKTAIKKADKELKGPYLYLREANNYEKNNPEKAEKIYEAGLKLYPDDLRLNSAYAIFLKNIRNKYDQAEKYYKKTMEIDPNNTITLDNYAIFLKTIRKKYDQAEEYYMKVMKIDPNDAINLGNYAIFLTDVRKKHDQAEEYFKKALVIEPNHPNNLSNYANFLTDVRKNYDQAEEYYEKALEIDPNHEAVLVNYAGFLLGRGKFEQGIRILEKIISQLPLVDFTSLEVAVWFFAFAHWQLDKRTNALSKLRTVLLEGKRLKFCDFSLNLERAKKDNHPEIEWLYKLADVINEKADIKILDGWSLWKNA